MDLSWLQKRQSKVVARGVDFLEVGAGFEDFLRLP